MAIPAAVQGSLCITHCSQPAIASGSPNVHFGGIPAARMGDPVVPHLQPGSPCTTHPSAIAMGSSTVHINGLPAAYVGCKLVACTAISVGVPKIFIGP
jgi:uncharacterized Zn-binding protein involved in type VI secretion